MEPTPPPAAAERKEMSFGDHLFEFRSHLIKSVLAVTVCSAGGLFFWKPLLHVFTGHPLSKMAHPPKLVFTTPTEAFVVNFKLGVFAGLLVAAPFVLYQVWCFVAPALYLREKKTIFPVVFVSTLFFVSGVFFGYRYVLPTAFAFLLDYDSAGLTPMLSINKYVGFIVQMLVGFGAVFELPVFAFVLARMGLITHRTLLKYLRHAVVVIFIVAAILTPSPDVFSQVMMAGPLLVLYGLSMGVAYLARKKNG
ncbi:MAG: twin-arginine translocase subunit TatC [Fibrobacterota bacterium]